MFWRVYHTRNHLHTVKAEYKLQNQIHGAVFKHKGAILRSDREHLPGARLVYNSTTISSKNGTLMSLFHAGYESHESLGIEKYISIRKDS